MIYDIVIDFLSESSLLLMWLGGWNLICLLISDDSVLICASLIVSGFVFRVLFFYMKNRYLCIDTPRPPKIKKRKASGIRSRKLYYIRLLDNPNKDGRK